MKIGKLISADSHVVEPPDLWQERIDRRCRDRAPRMIHDEGVDRCDMMFSGVFERFPRLLAGAVEFEPGWAAYFIQTMDRHYEEHRHVKEIRFRDGRLPSDYFHRNVFATFQEDVAGIMTRRITGVENTLWGSDFPHIESIWPRSREVLGELPTGGPEREVEMMTYANAARIVGFE